MHIFIKYILLLVSVSVFWVSEACGQVDSSILAMVELVKSYNHFGKYNPQEKVYLHFDNTGYYLGETIWFSAYVVTSPQLRPTEMSKVLYVELLTPEGRIVETKKLKIEGGWGHGEFRLTGPTLIGGFYEVRAYTRVMLNWEGTYFSRVFPVFDKPEEEGVYRHKITRYPRSQRLPQERESPPKLKSLNLTFYPEGGDLVSGLPGVVAFKAVDDAGRSLSVSGDIYDSEGRSVGQITTRHRGMGRFELTPGPNPHEVRITYDGKTRRYPLPAAKTEGYTLRAETMDPDSLHIQIRRSRGAKGHWVGLVVSCRGIAHSFEVSDLREEESAEFHLSRATFPEGVHQITLFTSEGEILGERLMFHYRGNSRLQIETEGEKPTYRPYEKVQLQVSVKDRELRPVPSRLSVSVRDVGREVPTNYRSDMAANLLLESDVRGYIEDVDYYFESTDADHRLGADLLMLVQGWRRYAWKEQTGIEPFEAKHKVEEGILVEGRVYDYRISGAKPRSGVELSVWVYSGMTNSRGRCTTDSLGRFTFLSDRDIWGKNELVLQSQKTNRRGKQKNMPYLIELDRQFSPRGRAYRVDEQELSQESEAQAEYIEDETYGRSDTLTGTPIEGLKVHNLGEVEVKGKRRIENRRPTIEYDVSEEVDKMIDSQVRDYTGSVLDFLTRKNPFFYEKSTKDGRKLITYKNRRVSFWCDGYWCLFEMMNDGSIDEDVHYGNIKKYPFFYYIIENIAIEDIKRIGIVEEADSVRVEMITYTNGEKKSEVKGYRMTTLQGYSIPSEYYHVDYSEGVLPDERDYRRTLYWNPDLATDSLGRAQVTFYNNSTATRLRVDVEAMSTGGISGIVD